MGKLTISQPEALLTSKFFISFTISSLLKRILERDNRFLEESLGSLLGLSTRMHCLAKTAN